ncbi:MAG: hypothetical protein F7B18_08280 [Desulfurococcales archaeon]|nr:hypothetical protein [Desulfurococcales archaeon]
MPLLPLTSSLIILAVVISPLYVFEGTTTGRVGLASYRVNVLGIDVKVDPLERPRPLVLAILVAPIQVAITLLLIPFRPELGRRLLVGASYNLVLSASLTWALISRLVSDVVSKLLARDVVGTNMGFIVLEPTIMEPTLVGRLWPLLLGASMVLAAVYIMYGVDSK